MAELGFKAKLAEFGLLLLPFYSSTDLVTLFSDPSAPSLAPPPTRGLRAPVPSCGRQGDG